MIFVQDENQATNVAEDFYTDCQRQPVLQRLKDYSPWLGVPNNVVWLDQLSGILLLFPCEVLFFSLIILANTKVNEDR